MGLSWWHIVLVLLVFVLLFGTGKISGLMGDVAKGIKSFKKGMAEDDEEEAEVKPVAPAPKAIEHKPVKPPVRSTKSTARAKAPRSHKSS
jgi:sec-independent protein translocase protein TatA